jgi:lactate dehydrogenase-like 2-hydroxyacid dehydrogenase
MSLFFEKAERRVKPLMHAQFAVFIIFLFTWILARNNIDNPNYWTYSATMDLMMIGVKKLKKKVILAGGTGFIGKYFEKQFNNLGYKVKIISRQPQHISWNDKSAIIEALEGAELLINLAGRWKS